MKVLMCFNGKHVWSNAPRDLQSPLGQVSSVAMIKCILVWCPSFGAAFLITTPMSFWWQMIHGFCFAVCKSKKQEEDTNMTYNNRKSVCCVLFLGILATSSSSSSETNHHRRCQVCAVNLFKVVNNQAVTNHLVGKAVAAHLIVPKHCLTLRIIPGFPIHKG